MRNQESIGTASSIATVRVNKPRGGWQHRLAEVINANNLVKVKRKHSREGTTSYRTREQRKAGMFLIFNTLTKELGYRLEDPANLKVKHIEALVEHWEQKNLSAGTIELYLSNLRTLCKWLKKEGMVRPLKFYAPNLERQYAATHDKSFEGANVNFWEAWEKIYQKDKYVGMQLLLIKAFGLRMKEAISFKPIVNDREHSIEVFDGTKGGRPRLVSIDNDFQMGVLALLKNEVRLKGNPKGHLGHPDNTLLQNMRRYSNVLRTCGVTKAGLGVTGHGLRAEYAIDQLISRGLVPTVRGGLGNKLKSFSSKEAALKVAEQLGHSRWSVMTAYGGKWMLIDEHNQYKVLEIRDQPLEGNEVTKKNSTENLQLLDKAVKQEIGIKNAKPAAQQGRLDI